MTPSWCGFISAPHRPGNASWHCPGTRLSAPPGLASPYSPGHALAPYNTSLSPFPGLCASGINRIDGAPAGGRNFQAFSPAPNPRAGRRVTLCAMCAAEVAMWQWWAAAAAGVTGASTWPCVGSALVSPACPGRWHAGGRRTKPGGGRAPACHAALPLSHHAAAGGTRVKFKESQQRQLLGLPSTGITASPSPASSCRGLASLGLCPLPASPPGSAVPPPAPLCTQRGFLIYRARP